MISDFIVQHPSGPFLTLNSDEWCAAVKKYSSLLADTSVEYTPRSATASIHVGVDGYFDNETVLQQFERLFKMLQFKKDYDKHDIEVLVGNARTHTIKEFSLSDLGKSIRAACPVEIIEYTDENHQQQQLQCYFKSGPNKNKSKGLLIIANELSISDPRKCKLDELRALLSQHRCFQHVRDPNIKNF